MALVAFLRGVNVGGKRKFSPAGLARELPELGLVNVGAAGTFVARRCASPARFRAAIAAKMPFAVETAVVPGRELARLVRSDPFRKAPAGGDIRRMVAVLTGRAPRVPRIPLRLPDGADWQIEIVAAPHPFVLYLWRPNRARMLYTNAIEKEFGVSSTTRSWGTIEKVHDLLSRG